MTTSISSGLGASFGVIAESAVGTRPGAPTRWLRFDQESLAPVKGTAQSVGLHQGLYPEKNRRNLLTKAAAGGVTFDLQTTQLGLLFKHMLGANTTGSNGTAVQQSASAAYRQNHAPGDTLGLGLTIEVGRPQSNGTIQSFTYTGSKVLDWTISAQRGQLAKLAVNLDAWAEDTTQTYTAPTLTTPNILDFSQGSLKLGGTPSTSSGVTSISGGAAPSGIVQSVSVKGTNPIKTDRYNLGSQTKSEQYANGFRSLEVEVQAEFATLSDFYTSLFSTDTPTPFELKLTGGTIPSGASNNFYVDVILSSVFWDEHPVIVQGPDVITVTVKGTGTDNNADNPVQIQYMSTDSSI